MKDAPTISILTAGIGLGIYIPSLLIARQVRAMGVGAEVETLETYYTAQGRDGQDKHQQAFRQDFALAQIANRMARGVEASLDPTALGELLAHWAKANRRHFLTWSGFWLPILERYKSMVSGRIHVDCCRIDAVVSASFRPYPNLEAGCTEIWLWNWNERRLVHEISVDERPPVAFADRSRRLVVHGGGWGIGTYRQVRSDLASTPWHLDTVVHDVAELADARAGDRCFMVDPGWRPWLRGAAGHDFPPFNQIGRAASQGAQEEHGLYQVIRQAKAIVSKPGGGTLIDSLSSATPLVLLDPYGAAEQRSGDLWEQLGFGIPYPKWRDSGHSEELLASLHANLLRARGRGIDYPRFCVERLRGRPWA